MPSFKLLSTKVLATVIASSFLLAACGNQADKTTQVDDQGAELQADAQVDTSKNVEIDKKYYQITYNTGYKGAVQVSYGLTRKKVNGGNIKDRPSFYREKLLDKKYQTVSNDYTNTGYDRGHLANDASFDSGKKSLLSTYSMANIVPMLPDVNRGGWLSVEDYERYMVNQFDAITVVNIVTYKTGHLLKKKPLEEVLQEKKFKSEKQKQAYIKRYQKYADNLAAKGIHQPIGFYKVISSERGDYKECFYVANKEGNVKQDHKLYLVDCEGVPVS